MIITEKNYSLFAIGSKAENLFYMRGNGIHIPPFFCVMEDGFKEAEIFAQSFFHSSDTVSVRSSASCEDGNGASFAGQFHTELCLPICKTGDAVRRVCTIPQSEGLSEYCKIHNVDRRKIKVCAIVQKMIEAEYSGVIFTANPMGILNESVIVIGRGIGENVVEDRADTTTYYYNNTDSLYYSEQNGNSPLIPDKLLKRLIRQADKIKKIFPEENELDIEFAIKNNEIFILQARPVTTLPPTGNPIILDNSNIVESYPGITLPLTQSFIREAYYRVFRSVLQRLTHESKTVAQMDYLLHNMVDAANGRIYYRISNWYDVLLFLPFNRKIIPIWQEMLGVKNKKVTSHLTKKIGFFTHMKVCFSFINLLICCPKLMNGLDQYFKSVIADYQKIDLTQLGNEDILALYRSMLDKITQKWDLTLVNDMYSFLYTGLLRSLLKAKKIPHPYAAANQYISGLNGIESMKPVTGLIRIAKFVRDNGELSTMKKQHSAEDCRAYLERGSRTAQMITKYIELYGDRNTEELKLESRTFRTNPELLIQKIIQYAENGTSAVTAVNQKPKPLKGLCKVLARKAAVGIKNREKSRLNRSRLYGMMRTMMLQIGGELAAMGQISSQRDIFYLRYDEIENAVKSGEKMQKVIEERRILYKCFENLPAYSRLIFADKVFDKNPRNIREMQTFGHTDILTGIACSGGTARGEVLVVKDPSMHLNTAGKILVAKMTDPGWVFLIADAAGIIAEKGSLLSHTAIISRELGKPAVVGVENAANLLKNGDIVEINGTAGKITVIERTKS